MTLVRIPEASLATGIPIGTLRRWIAAGTLPVRLIDGAQHVDLADVETIRDAPMRAWKLALLDKLKFHVH